VLCCAVLTCYTLAVWLRDGLAQGFKFVCPGGGEKEVKGS